MIYTIKFKINENLKGITTEHFRSSVIDKCTNILTNEDMKLILGHYSVEEFKNKSRKLPYIIFSKPYGNFLMLKAYEDEGLELLNRIKKVILSDNTLNINNEVITIKTYKIYTETLYPELTEDLIGYKTLTPILLYKRAKRKAFDGIYYKYQNDKVEMRKELIKDSTNILRAKIKNILCTFKGNDDYSFFDEIDINWTDLKIIMITDKGEKTPALVGEFNSHWELPRVIGDRTGIGYGQIHKIYKGMNK